MTIFSPFPQPLLHVVEPFAKKFNCLEVVTNEYRRRLQNDDNTSNPYRHAKVPSESIFVAALTNDTISIEKYNSISNSWKLFATLSIIGIKSRSNCGFVFIENTIIIIGGRKGQTYLRTVSYTQFHEANANNPLNEMIIAHSNSSDPRALHILAQTKLYFPFFHF